MVGNTENLHAIPLTILYIFCIVRQTVYLGGQFMDKKEIQDKLIDILAKHTQIDTANLNPDQHLKYDLGLDSLDVAEMVYEIEEEFGITISDESAEKIQKISDTVDFIYEQMQGNTEEGTAPQES